ncbi:alpha/beta fold hydrolase [Paraburkholderia rhynchosiae]|uniref:Proline iminopeptidase n=1 Tax=Paraburkholderia rhynchosiae TaxID=487049 RepID=A0A2N7WM96_9BURK|nr:alpha/beta fold hydrolase [Paraburkholderia rhynchosiae]PMS30558.1 prolyl aminopeptidase [Paraburkholderia rhynchosiae]CAB3683585.1 Proline iminopeptidase [Paraburkholderia rhynchosiae]
MKRPGSYTRSCAHSYTRPRSQHGSSQAPLTLDALRTRDGQRVSFAVAGAADGVPVVVLHGGPGSGSQPDATRLFDLTRFRIVLIDQRGTGRSTPGGSVRRNRTDRLIEDIEAVRMRLGVERWGVLGGSWGAALALAYAGRHPQSVTGVVLRGLFLTSMREVRGLFVASRKRAPGAWAKLCAAARCERPADLLARCHAQLQRGGAGDTRQQTIALAWRGYENAVLASASARRKRVPARDSRKDSRKLVGKYRIQAHYLVHRCWLGETQLLSLAHRAAAAGVPLAAVHGSRDPVCPPDNLWRLARAVPTAHVECVRAGHLASDPALHERTAHALATMFLPPTHEGRTLRHAA